MTKVNIINQTPSGRSFLEGVATRKGLNENNQAWVWFDGESDPVSRIVDPDAQGLTREDLDAYIEGLNSRKTR